MPTPRLSIELDDLQYEILQNAVTSGHYASESEAVSSLILDPFHEGDPEALTSSLSSSHALLRNEVAAACAEADEHPERLLTGDQVLGFLSEEPQARNAA